MTLIVQKVRWGELMGSNFWQDMYSLASVERAGGGIVFLCDKVCSQKNHNQIVTTKVKNGRCLNQVVVKAWEVSS